VLAGGDREARWGGGRSPDELAVVDARLGDEVEEVAALA
jgi:hypothetical protein